MGIQFCKWQCSIPVAIPAESGHVAMFELGTFIIGGSGKMFLIIVGLKSVPGLRD